MILTPTEQRVIQGLLDGLTNKEIAEALHVSERAVKFHASSIYRKQRVGSRTELLIVGREFRQAAKEWERLTDLQKRICRLSLEYSVLGVAKELGLSKGFVWNHQQIAFGILGVKGRVGLAVYMGRYALVKDEAEVIEMQKERKTA